MPRQKKKVRFFKHKLKVWAMDGNPNGDIKTASFVHY
jgi:hypothetical protein